MDKAECPNVDLHKPMPDGYVDRAAWFDEMGKTHRAKKCPGCQRFMIWVPKSGHPHPTRAL